MKRHYSKFVCSRPLLSERGVYLVFVSLLLVAIMGVVALVVDISMITLAQVRVRRAVDAAQTAGLAFRTQQGWRFFRANPDYQNIPARNADKEKELGLVAHAAAHTNLDSRQGAFTTFGCNVPPPPPPQPGEPDQWQTCAHSDAVGGSAALNRTSVYYNSTNDEISITASTVVPLFFSRLFGNVSVCSPYVAPTTSPPSNPPAGACHIAFSSTSRLNPVRVALVLDTSGSMNSSINLTSVDTRLEVLRGAVRDFIERLNPNRDFLSMVPFNFRAEDPLNNNPVWSFWVRDGTGTARPFGVGAARSFTIPGPPPANVNPTNRYQELFLRLNNLRAAGNTNIADGLFAARRDYQPTGIDGEPFSVILFSDGAPTAATFRPVAPSPAMMSRLQIVGDPRTSANNLVTQFVINHPGTGTPPQSFDGPSPLLRADLVTYGELPGIMVAPDPPLPAPPIARCGTFQSIKTNFHRTMWNTFISGSQSDMLNSEPCLNNLAFYRDRDFPDLAGVGNRITSSVPECMAQTTDELHEACLRDWTLGAGFAPDPFNEWQDFTQPGTAGVWSSPYYYIQHMYNVTIEAADSVRRSNGTVFVVALGPEGSAADPAGNDPYWRLWDSNSRKDPFLRRLADDRFRGCLQEDHSFALNNISAGIPNSWGYRGHVALSANANCEGTPMSIPIDGTTGRYVAIDSNAADAANRLRDAFVGLANDIIMRLN